MKDLSFPLAAVCAAVVVVSFFVPWVSMNSPVVGTLSKVFSENKDSFLMKISGYQVPILANGEDSKLMIRIIQLFNPGVKDADKKSWLIWVIPIFAVLMAAAFMSLQKNKWFNLAVGIIGILVFAVGVYKLTTTNLDKMVMKVTILPGLWLVLCGYLGIGISGALNFFMPPKISKS